MIDWNAPLMEFRVALVVLVWTCMLVAALTGYIYSPNFRMRRSDDPRGFWQAYAVFIVVALVASYLLLFSRMV